MFLRFLHVHLIRTFYIKRQTGIYVSTCLVLISVRKYKKARFYMTRCMAPNLKPKRNNYLPVCHAFVHLFNSCTIKTAYDKKVDIWKIRINQEDRLHITSFPATCLITTKIKIMPAQGLMFYPVQAYCQNRTLLCLCFIWKYTFTKTKQTSDWSFTNTCCNPEKVIFCLCSKFI